MLKRLTASVLLIFVSWSGIDYILHGVLLKSTYEGSAHLWRPTKEMNLSLVYVVTFVLIVSFVMIYHRQIGTRSLCSGIQYGAVFGLATGIASGFGTYIHMPIPLTLAWAWFIGGWLKMVAAGAIVGAVLKAKEQERPRRCS